MSSYLLQTVARASLSMAVSPTWGCIHWWRRSKCGIAYPKLQRQRWCQRQHKICWRHHIYIRLFWAWRNVRRYTDTLVWLGHLEVTAPSLAKSVLEFWDLWQSGSVSPENSEGIIQLETVPKFMELLWKGRRCEWTQGWKVVFNHHRFSKPAPGV